MNDRGSLKLSFIFSCLLLPLQLQSEWFKGCVFILAVFLTGGDVEFTNVVRASVR